MKKTISKILSHAAKRVAPAYVAGPAIDDALRICRHIRGKGWFSAICPWDGPDDSSRDVVESYSTALNSIISDGANDCYLSVKAPSISYDFEMLREILEISSEYNIRIHFDSHGPETVHPTFELIEKALKLHGNLGYTLPARWRRSLSDAERAVGLGIAVRVVKGQWPDQREPDLDHKGHYLEIIDLLAEKSSMVAVATHDKTLAQKSLSRLKRSGTTCELEQLYGLPLCIDSVAEPLGIRGRVYVPYGHAYLPYAVSEIRKRPIILAWLFKDMFVGNHRITEANQL